MFGYASALPPAPRPCIAGTLCSLTTSRVFDISEQSFWLHGSGDASMASNGKHDPATTTKKRWKTTGARKVETIATHRRWHRNCHVVFIPFPCSAFNKMCHCARDTIECHSLAEESATPLHFVVARMFCLCLLLTYLSVVVIASHCWRRTMPNSKQRQANTARHIR